MQLRIGCYIAASIEVVACSELIRAHSVVGFVACVAYFYFSASRVVFETFIASIGGE